ncbi:MAG TPA: hypothetical protein VGL81_31515 [Polyangiaceae bacterium]|jgi:hypothetical protein
MSAKHGNKQTHILIQIHVAADGTPLFAIMVFGEDILCYVATIGDPYESMSAGVNEAVTVVLDPEPFASERYPPTLIVQFPAGIPVRVGSVRTLTPPTWADAAPDVEPW